MAAAPSSPDVAKSLCVFCGSSPGVSPDYVAAAKDVGAAIANKQWRLVYGGGAKGCMGAVSSSVLEKGGSVLGVIPEVMTTSAPRGHPEAGQQSAPSVPGVASSEGTGDSFLNGEAKTQLKTVVTRDMHQRKQLMAKQSGLGFIGLPGGYGTFEEVFEMITWSQLGIHRKPIVLVNVLDFFSPLKAMVEQGVSSGFITETGRSLVAFVSPEDAKAAGGWGAAATAEIEAMKVRLEKSGAGYWDWKEGKGEDLDISAEDAEMEEAKPLPLSEVDEKDLAVDVRNLTFSFVGSQGEMTDPALVNCNLQLTRGSRCLLIGANGAGKSTILRLLAGKRLPNRDSHVRVFNKDVFHDAPRGITYLGTEWAMNPVVRSDIRVSHFLDSVGGYRHKARRDELLNILDVDLEWRMHQISDGERRRVQLTMGLMEEWDVLLLDEVTVDLDVQVRTDLLDFLMRETVQRKATIIYATHIFDGLQRFPTHVSHMRLGTTCTDVAVSWPPTDSAWSSEPDLKQIDYVRKQRGSKDGREPSALLNTALAWLRIDRGLRAEAEKAKGRQRGARQTFVETDSEKFYSKYDYSQEARR